MRSTRVLLIDPSHFRWLGESAHANDNPVWIGERNPYPVSPSLLALYSHLVQNGVDDVEILDLSLEDLRMPSGPEDVAAFEQRCASLLAGYEYDIAAISCFTTFSYHSAKSVARVSKRVRPDALVAVGGWHVLGEPRDFDASDGVDFVVQGAGEKPLLALARGELRKRSEASEIIASPPLLPAEHAALSYRLEEYVHRAPARYQSLLADARQVMITSSRGCPEHCRYCANRFLEPRRWAPLEVDAIVDLVAQARRVHPKLEICVFGDASFGLNARWRRELLPALARNHPDLPFSAILRPEILQAEDAELLARAHAHILLGVEAFSPEILAVMRKTLHPERYIERTKRVIRALRDAGVGHDMLMICNHPGETAETIDQTRRHLDDVLVEGTHVMLLRYMFFSQFVVDYAEYQRRFGTEFRGNPRWWEQPFVDFPSLNRGYIPSREPGESFEHAQERLLRALAPLEKIGLEWRRREKMTAARVSAVTPQPSPA